MFPDKIKNDTKQIPINCNLISILDVKHELVILASKINWDDLVQYLESYYSPNRGRKGKPIRLMVGLQILKHTYALSDEEVVSRYKENPYWQYFCGSNSFENKLPIVATSLTKFRNRIGKLGFKKIFETTIKIGLKEKIIKKSSCESVIVDTTVTENNITYPTDAKLLEKARNVLVSLAKKSAIKLRQTYSRVSPKSAIKSARYFHARQIKKGKKAVKKSVLT